uniref:Uncharacterized protein n=1 Tax=Romanomermis culicivorax TaxID=13658 RepID=A0A915ITI5_ROMCU
MVKFSRKEMQSLQRSCQKFCLGGAKKNQPPKNRQKKIAANSFSKFLAELYGKMSERSVTRDQEINIDNLEIVENSDHQGVCIMEEKFIK